MTERRGGTGEALAPVVTESAAPTAVSEIRPRPVPARPRVLVIDDDALVRAMMVRALERFGFEVLSADGGRAALGIFRERAEAIDVVLLDLTMPEISGEETFAALREIDPGVRIVFSSGAALGTEGDGLPAGFTGFVQKPCLPTQLAEALYQALGGAQTR